MHRALTTAAYAGALVVLVPNVVGFVWAFGFRLGAPFLGVTPSDIGVARAVFPVNHLLGIVGYAPIVIAWLVTAREAAAGWPRTVAMLGAGVAVLAVTSRLVGTALGMEWDLVDLAEPVEHAAVAALLSAVPAARSTAIAALVATQMQIVASLALAILPTGTMAVAVGGMLLWLTGLVMSWGFLAIALYRARPTA